MCKVYGRLGETRWLLLPHSWIKGACPPLANSPNRATRPVAGASRTIGSSLGWRHGPILQNAETAGAAFRNLHDCRDVTLEIHRYSQPQSLVRQVLCKEREPNGYHIGTRPTEQHSG